MDTRGAWRACSTGFSISSAMDFIPDPTGIGELADETSPRIRTGTTDRNRLGRARRAGTCSRSSSRSSASSSASRCISHTLDREIATKPAWCVSISTSSVRNHGDTVSASSGCSEMTETGFWRIAVIGDTSITFELPREGGTVVSCVALGHARSHGRGVDIPAVCNRRVAPTVDIIDIVPGSGRSKWLVVRGRALRAC